MILKLQNVGSARRTICRHQFATIAVAGALLATAAAWAQRAWWMQQNRNRLLVEDWVDAIPALTLAREAFLGLAIFSGVLIVVRTRGHLGRPWVFLLGVMLVISALSKFPHKIVETPLEFPLIHAVRLIGLLAIIGAAEAATRAHAKPWRSTLAWVLQGVWVANLIAAALQVGWGAPIFGATIFGARPFGLTPLPNTFGLLGVLYLCLPRRHIPVNHALTAITCAAILLSGSRAAIAGLAAWAFSKYFFSLRLIASRMTIALAGLASLPALVWIASLPAISGRTIPVGIRTEKWMDLVALATSPRDILFGLDPGRFTNSYLTITGNGVAVDSMPVAWFLNFGLFGLTLLAAACYQFFACSNRNVQTALIAMAPAVSAFLVMDWGYFSVALLTTLGILAGSHGSATNISSRWARSGNLR
ncbi:MAG: hypothetical protein ACPHID_07830 [Thermoplasmatota archaeon]